MEGFRNILLIQLGDIGDVVVTTPAIRAVKETYPEARISILVRKPFGNLLSADPYIHEVVEFAKVSGSALNVLREYASFVRRLRRARYDLVIDLRTGDRGAILSFLTGGRERVGRNSDRKQFWHKLMFTKTVNSFSGAPQPVHPGADQSLRVLRSIGIDTKDSSPKLYVAPHDRERAALLLAECGLAAGGRWVTINPCSRWKYKEWGYEKWGKVIDHLWQNHRLPAVLIGSPEEVGAAGEIVAGRSGRAFNLAGKTTLGELAALLQMSCLHLGVDSAAPHIAAAVGTPTVTIFGPGNWRSWTTVDFQHRVITAGMPCVPCNHKGCDDTEKSRCIDELGVDAVMKPAEEVLERIGKAAPGGATTPLS